MRSPVRIWIAAPAQDTSKPEGFGVFLFCDRSYKASPFGRGVTEGDGEGKPGRIEPRYSDKQALCQSGAIAVYVILRQRPCPLSLASLASSPKGGAVGVCKNNKNRAAGNVRTCGAVYRLEEIVLVENGFLNPVGTIKIVYFIWRKKSTRVVKIRGTCSFAQNKTP